MYSIIFCILNKYDFIKGLINNKDLTPSQRDRILRLSVKEFGEDAEIIEDLKRRLAAIEYVIINKEITKDSGITDTILNVNIYPTIHYPQKTVKLLKYFTANDKSLKYTTHSWDKGKFSSFKNFLASIQNEWKSISEDLKKQNNRLHAKIFNFLFNKKLGEKDGLYYKSWGEKKLKFGWSSNELKEFMNSGENRDPFNCPIPDRIKQLEKGINLFYFKDYIDIFKNEIEIREENNVLKKLINKIKTEELSFDFKVTTENIEGKSFYTDVSYFKESLKLIFRSFKNRTEFPEIIIMAKSDFSLNFLQLNITQKDSICQRSIEDPKIASPTGGEFGDLIKNLNGLADFSISAKFIDNKCYRINYLASNENAKHIEDVENVNGFTYELKFYL